MIFFPCLSINSVFLCFPQTAECDCVSVWSSALLNVCLCICLFHLKQCFMQFIEEICGGEGTGVCFKVYVVDKPRIKY